MGGGGAAASTGSSKIFARAPPDPGRWQRPSQQEMPCPWRIHGASQNGLLGTRDEQVTASNPNARLCLPVVHWQRRQQQQRQHDRAQHPIGATADRDGHEQDELESRDSMRNLEPQHHNFAVANDTEEFGKGSGEGRGESTLGIISPAAAALTRAIRARSTAVEELTRRKLHRENGVLAESAEFLAFESGSSSQQKPSWNPGLLPKNLKSSNQSSFGEVPREHREVILLASFNHGVAPPCHPGPSSRQFRIVPLRRSMLHPGTSSA